MTSVCAIAVNASRLVVEQVIRANSARERLPELIRLRDGLERVAPHPLHPPRGGGQSLFAALRGLPGVKLRLSQ